MLVLERMVATDPRLPLSRPELEMILGELLALYGHADAEVALRIVDDMEIAALNAEFMGCLGPTNILSFPEEISDLFGAGRAVRLGDLVLSAETVLREAFFYNQPYHEYIVRLLAHGLLHLMGYDHGSDMDELTDLAVATIRVSDSARLFSEP